MIRSLSRRHILKAVTGSLAMAALANFAFAADAPVAAKPKNIVFILSDDVGYGDLSCYGSKLSPTPNIDRLATQGLKFSDANSACPVCTASRYAVLTGEYGWRRSIPEIARGDSKLLIKTDQPTLPKAMQSAGYYTAAIGKWHLGFTDGKPDWNKSLRPGPQDVGFDDYFGLPSTNDRVPCVYVENDHVVGLDPTDPITVVYGPEEKTTPGVSSYVQGTNRIGAMSGGKAALFKDDEIADKLTGRVCETIEKNKGKPFFIYFAAHDIHVPNIAGKRFKNTSQTGTRGDMLNELDSSVGRVLDTLDRLKLADDTLVIFSSDNGGAYTGNMKQTPDYKVNGDLRGLKSNLWEGGSRVPLIFRWPGHIPAGTQSNQMICLIDLYASLVAMTGSQLPSDAAPDSFDFSKVVLDPTITKSVRDHLITANSSKDVTLRMNGWKFIPIAGAGGYGGKPAEKGSPPEQLYHLSEDPSEKNNLINAEPAQAEILRTRRRELIDAGSSRPGFRAKAK